MSMKTGDVVRLVSGGPLMTVDESRAGGLIAVLWFHEGLLERDAFYPVQLTPASTGEFNPMRIMWATGVPAMMD